MTVKSLIPVVSYDRNIFLIVSIIKEMKVSKKSITLKTFNKSLKFKEYILEKMINAYSVMKVQLNVILCTFRKYKFVCYIRQ